MTEQSRGTGPGQLDGPGAKTDRDLERIRAAWSRLEAAEPPELVDRQVLNAARRAVAPPARRWRWIGGFATAGVVVLTISLALLQEWRPAAPQPTIEHFEMRQAPPAADAAVGPAAEAAGALRSETAEADAAPEAQFGNEAQGAGSSARSAARSAAQSDAQPSAPARAKAGDERRAPPSAAPLRDAAEDAPPTPEEWIDRLLRLRAQGDEEAYARELAEFRAVYPDLPLPPELAD